MNDVDKLSSLLQGTTIPLNGVSFEGRGLKLNTAEDAVVVVDAIKNCTGPMEFLNLAGNTVGVEAAKAIAEALESCPHLRRALWKDMFTGRLKTEIPLALKALGKGLMTAGAQLEVLELSDNASGPIGVDGISELLSSRVCWSLKELRLANMGLGVGGAKKLAQSLMACCDSAKQAGTPFALKVFIAGRNRLENPGITALSKVFKSIGSLEEIQIPQNGIYPDGISALCSALVVNNNLRFLNLNDNTLSTVGAASLAETLASLPKLTHLDIGDSLIKTQGAQDMARAFSKHPFAFLEEVIMSGNEIRANGGIAIVTALSKKPRMKMLNLDCNGFGSSIEEIEEMSSALSFQVSMEDDEGSDDDDDERDHGEDQEEEYDDGDGYGEESDPGTATDDDEDECEEEDDDDGDDTNDSKVVLGGVGPNSFMSPMRRDIPNAQPVPFSFSQPKLNSAPEYTTEIEDQIRNLPDNEKVEEIIKAITTKYSNQEELALSLYEKLFSIASRDSSLLSQINNQLMSYMGYIKLERKELKKQMDVRANRSILSKAMTKEFFPAETKTLIKFFEKA